MSTAHIPLLSIQLIVISRITIPNCIGIIVTLRVASIIFPSSHTPCGYTPTLANGFSVISTGTVCCTVDRITAIPWTNAPAVANSTVDYSPVVLAITHVTRKVTVEYVILTIIMAAISTACPPFAASAGLTWTTL